MSACQSVLTILGWSLLDSIWQMAVMWMAYNMLTAGNKRISPAGKHNLILLFVFIGTEWFFYTFIHLLNEPTTPFLPGFIPVSPSANYWISWFSSVYLVILLVRLLQYIFQYFGDRENKDGKFLSKDHQAFADRYSRILGIHRRVQVYLCEFVETAETSRFLKPLILLPVSLVGRLSPLQVEAIVVHELYHIRRNDYLINICISCIRSIFFFNPFAQLFYKALARERELACDDGVMELGFAPDLYAEALFSLEKFRQPQPGFSLAADGNKPWLLMERIQRVLGKPKCRKNRVNPLIIFSGLIAITLLILQPKTSVTKETVRVSAKPIAVMPTRYELAEEKIYRKEKEQARKTTGFHKRIKKESIPGLKPFLETAPAEESDPPDQAYFAVNNIVRDYSNQPAADLSQDPIPGSSSTPYVPSVSLSYEARPVIIASDSARDIIIKNDIKEIVSLSNLKAIASLKDLKIQIDKNRQELNRIEIQNQKLFLLEQRNIKPLLKKMQKQIEFRKKQIDGLRTRLEVSEEEIIHI
jgi:Zn-dependent protease with chaperone function